MAKNEKKENKITKQRKIFSVVVGLIVLISLLLIISGLFGNFLKVKLKTNKKEIFNISDLTVGNLEFGATENDVLKEYGEPNKKEEIVKNNYQYKVYYYKGLTLTLKEHYNNYTLVKAEITSSKYKTSRKVKVGDKILNTINKYNVSIRQGNYIYKNYSYDALNNKAVKDEVFLGIRNDNEVRYYIRYAYVEDAPNNVAVLSFKYKFGKIKSIVWSYDVFEK